MVVLMLGLGGTASAQTPFTIDDALRIAELSEPAITPDGARIVYTVTTNDRKRDKQLSDLWSVDWASARRQPVTRTVDKSEWQPAFSSDGRVLAFLSDATDDDTTQLFTMAARGGRPRQASAVPGGISDYALSPDGRRAVVVAEVGRTVGSKAKTPPPIVIDRFAFKEDGRGRLDDRRQQLMLVDVADRSAQPLTRGAFDHWLPAWSPDGRWIAFVSRQSGADPDRTIDYDVYVMAPDATATARRLSTPVYNDNEPGWATRLAWSPDSKRLAWVERRPDDQVYYAPFELVVADVATGALVRPPRIDRSMTRPVWTEDGSALLLLVEQDRTTRVARIDAVSGAISYLTGEDRFAVDLVAAGGRAAVLDGDVNTPYLLRTVETTPRILADHNDWLRERSLAVARDIEVASTEGARIGGLLLTPPGAPAGASLPLIVRLHGGPVYQYSREFMADWQVYAANGYAVLGLNPRGSSGKGYDFARAIFADWGNRDVKDIIAGVDWTVKQGIADPQRIGIGGWSYGGILANALIASDTRFKAAISGAGASNFIGLYGVDQYARDYEAELGLPWRDRAAWDRVSFPFLHADRIRTPTLFQCAADDDNVPCAGSEHMYLALRSLGVPTQLVVYPGQSHGLDVPSYIADRLRRNLDWYARWLQPGAGR